MDNYKLDILLYVITFTVIIWLFIKTSNDYKKLTSPDKKRDLIINPRSFLWKGGLFIFAGLYMSQTAVTRSLLSLILFISLTVLGVWNIYHAFLYFKWQKRK